MARINYDNRRFAPQSNTLNGEVDPSTVFHYRQCAGIVWATYAGGSVRFGTLIAKVLDDDSLDMRYSHVNEQGQLMTGRCRSIPETLDDGRLRLHETWTWTSGDKSSGTSVIEEIKD
ncbi:MAG: hypothetical protein MSG64_01035 [Pyrinomonadaceae bacterium MAG19_C2-C3]|nr:hypothetical protein [Pyrinomonadaceae bacterium MAG19_C2-C3]